MNCVSYGKIIKAGSMFLRKYFFFFFMILMMACSHNPSQRRDNHDLGRIQQVLFSDDAVKYFSIYVDLTEEQKLQIRSIAQEYASTLKAMPREEREKNTGRYIVKYMSRTIRDVLTMEQAEKFVEEDLWANELFSEK